KRKSVSQFREYDSAVNAFRLKYDAIPGDMDGNIAPKFGFSFDWGTSIGLRNGNGILEQRYQDTHSTPPTSSNILKSDEFVLFWNDLLRAGLLKSFSGNPLISYVNWACNTAGGVTINSLDDCFPKTELNSKAHVFIVDINSVNYYYVGHNELFGNIVNSDKSYLLTPNQMKDLDNKIDDGSPSSGNLQNTYTAFTTVSLGSGLIGANACQASSTTYNNSKISSCAMILKMAP
ncbi:MAG: hypothetical protein WCJ33_06320, partial [Pseudomonadota bacterium]